MTLQEKIQESLALIRKGERLALAMNPTDGYIVGFSGGKDSQALLELVHMAGVKHRAYYSVTTNDPPENVYFIRRSYPEIEFIHPKRNFFKIVEAKGLPTMKSRFCCQELKEGIGVGSVVLTGVRADESRNRANYPEVKVYSRRKEHKDGKARNIEEIEANEHRCIKGKDKLMVYPLLHWTETEVWEFLKERGIPTNPCYEVTGRVGCMFCPYSRKGQIAYYEETYPKFKEHIMASLRVFWDKHQEHILQSPEEYYQWWKSKKSIKQFRKVVEK